MEEVVKVSDVDMKVKRNFSIPVWQDNLLNKISGNVGINKSAIVQKALTEFFKKYGDLIKEGMWNTLFEKLLE